MSDDKFISPEYIPISEAFLSLPLPEDPWSLLLPLEDDENREDPLDLLDGLDDLTELGDYVLDSADVDINKEPIASVSYSYPDVKNNRFLLPQHPPPKADIFTHITANNRQPLSRNCEVGNHSSTLFPEWLVEPKALNGTTHTLCTVEVRDFKAKRLKLLCMNVTEKVATGDRNATCIKNSEKSGDSVSNSCKTSTLQKVSNVVHLKDKKPSAMKGFSGERPINPAKEAVVTLLSEKLFNHLHKLSKINVPVLESSSRCSTSEQSKSRRKQMLLPQCFRLQDSEPTTDKLETVPNEMSTEGSILIVPNKASKQLTDNEEVTAEQPSASRVDYTCEPLSGTVMAHVMDMRKFGD
ncbi:uncharacterized protein LOC126566482 [Anopheles maculipalpis]|uniref:uncharacterized protein LOC126566482 n=1 Tax=Anopheles maculipalpis TaxID=1496333 RepID=UPI0021593B97|nr:uncharacterized protein LOC126566482 [Anopheles maculipalpis]